MTESRIMRRLPVRAMFCAPYSTVNFTFDVMNFTVWAFSVTFFRTLFSVTMVCVLLSSMTFFLEPHELMTSGKAIRAIVRIFVAFIV